MTIILNYSSIKCKDKKRSKRKKEMREAREKMLSKHKTRFDHIKEIIPVKRQSSLVIRDTPVIPSLNTHTGNTELKEKKEYTGDKLLGIATMHKSNMVPVFSIEEATEVSRMRRG